MNLTDQPTPVTVSSTFWTSNIPVVQPCVCAHQERLARAWREVAEKYRSAATGAVFHFEGEEAEMNEADEAFETLKKQADEQ